jgi:hypothetical protein
MTILHLITDDDCVTMYARRFAEIILAKASAPQLQTVVEYAGFVAGGHYTPRRFIVYATTILPIVTVSEFTNAVMDLQQHYLVEDAREKLANRVAALVRLGYEYGWSGDTEKLGMVTIGDCDPADDDVLSLDELRELRRDCENGGK